jgi:hypothetical protein
LKLTKEKSALTYRELVELLEEMPKVKRVFIWGRYHLPLCRKPLIDSMFCMDGNETLTCKPIFPKKEA